MPVTFSASSASSADSRRPSLLSTADHGEVGTALSPVCDRRAASRHGGLPLHTGKRNRWSGGRTQTSPARRALQKGDIVATDAVEDGTPSGGQLLRAEIGLEQLGKWFVAELALMGR